MPMAIKSERSIWPLRQAYTTGFQNIQYNLLVPTDKIRLPPIHIKLGIFKNFIKVLDRESESGKRLYRILPNLSEAKLTAVILNGRDIQKLTSDLNFPTLLSSKGKVAWGGENDKFHGDLKKVSDQHCERCHQSIAVFKSRYVCAFSH